MRPLNNKKKIKGKSSMSYTEKVACLGAKPLLVKDIGWSSYIGTTSIPIALASVFTIKGRDHYAMQTKAS